MKPALVIDNVLLEGNSPKAVVEASGPTILIGSSAGSKLIRSWAMGRRYTTMTQQGNSQTGDLPLLNKPKELLAQDKFYAKSKPQYDSLSESHFMSVLNWGVKNDGTNSAANGQLINVALAITAAQRIILVFPAGIYAVEDTIKIPLGSRIVGVLWSQIMAVGKSFNDPNNVKILAK
jgi:glucan 1,3-beta-glucosidase